jgi:hypothetical protein
MTQRPPEQLAFLAGIVERDRILALLRDNHSTYISLLRAYAREIAVLNGTVMIDEVREKAKLHNLPMPDEVGIDARVMGTVLAGCKDFEPCGQVLSTRAERIARSGKGASWITVYRLRHTGGSVMKEIA